MFHFADAWNLLLLLAVPALAWLWRRQRRGTLRFPDLEALTGLPEGRSRWARRGGASLRVSAWLLLVLALAGPRFADWRSRLPTEGIAIAAVLDVSGSMATHDFDWEGIAISRLEAAQRAFQLFVSGGEGPGGVQLDGRPNDLISLVTFATWPDSVCPLTLSHAVLSRLLEAEQPRTVPGESETNLSDAIALALHHLESASTKRKVLILLSDGEHNVARPQSAWTPRQAAQIAANLHVPIYTIDTGGDTGADDERGPSDPTQRARTRASAERTLRSVASLTGGRYFQAHDTHSLLDVYRDIDRLEKQAIRSFQYRRYHEAYPWLALAAFSALVILQVLELTVWQRIP